VAREGVGVVQSWATEHSEAKLVSIQRPSAVTSLPVARAHGAGEHHPQLCVQL